MISRDTYIELTKFGIVGSICFGLDLAMYYGLTEMAGFPIWAGKSCSVAMATFLNYYLNKTWTWGHNNRDRKRLAKYLILYAISGVLNVVSNQLLFEMLPKNEFQMLLVDLDQAIQTPFLAMKVNKLLAVLGATGVGMMVNFIGQKLWVFKDHTGY